MLIVGTMTSPFVAFVHLRLPPAARGTSKALQQFCENLPRDAQLDFTTSRLSGFSRTTGARVWELRPLPKRLLRLANIERVSDAHSPWWIRWAQWAAPRNRFYVGGTAGTKRSRAPGIWDQIVKQMAKGSRI